jgi:ABC-2 type transport system permease protein
MKHKLWAVIKKETLILVRDKIGLSIVFIMPMILIIVMTLVQESAFKTLNEKGIPIILVNDDQDTLGLTIYRGLKNSTFCHLHDSIDGKPATSITAKEAVAKGQFLIGIVIPKGATQAIRDNVSNLVNETLVPDTIETDENQVKSDSVNIIFYIDPVAKKSFITSITSYMHEFIAIVKTQIMFQTFSLQIADLIPNNFKKPKNTYDKSQIINYKEVFASNLTGEIVPNAVQHNVPAWTIFAMFFIVIPISGSILKEKKEGSLLRLLTMPTSNLVLMNGKVIVYVIVCTIQFILMLAVGIYILPFFGLQSLELGNNLLAIYILAIATSFAATGYGVMVGTLASSEQQSSIVGSLSILLMAALGGILVPTYVMPQIMRDISELIPLNWSLDGFYKLFFRGAGVADIIVLSFKLIAFFIATMFVASIVNRLKHKL